MKNFKRRLKNRLFCLSIGAFMCQSAALSEVAIETGNQTQETNLRADLSRAKSAKDKASVLVQLALVRERLGKLQEALATWDLVKKQYGTVKVEQFPSSALSQSGAKLADFFGERVKRKQKQKTLRKLDRTTRLHIAQGVQDWRARPLAAKLDLTVQADLDGDGIDELFLIGSNGLPGKHVKNMMGIARWSGQSYVIVWKSQRRIPSMVHVVDEDGDGWKEILCGYTPDSDDAATLYFNGKQVLFY
jgi:ATP/maltotriose-dependent transcriptional regulator MalT